MTNQEVDARLTEALRRSDQSSLSEKMSVQEEATTLLALATCRHKIAIADLMGAVDCIRTEMLAIAEENATPSGD